MLELGLQWLEENPNFDFDAVAIFAHTAEWPALHTVEAEELSMAMLDDLTIKIYGATGNMRKIVVFHLAFIHRNSRDEWLEELRNSRDPKDFFVFDAERTRPAPPRPDGKDLDLVMCRPATELRQ